MKINTKKLTIKRGLGYFRPGIHTDVQIGLPPREESHGDGRVFLRAVF